MFFDPDRKHWPRFRLGMTLIGVTLSLLLDFWGRIFGDSISNSRGGLRRRVNAATLTLSAPVAEG